MRKRCFFSDTIDHRREDPCELDLSQRIDNVVADLL